MSTTDAVGPAGPGIPASTASTTAPHRGDPVTPPNQQLVNVDDEGVKGEESGRDVSALLERGRTLSTPVLRAAVERLAPPMDTVAAYHFGWIDADGRPSDAAGGKAVRPALALLSAEVTGGPPQTGIPGAVAVELVHNFSLLHDDLMDGDEQRRHRDTVWKVHGPAQAILVGDALFALAGEILLELGTVEAGRATRRLTVATRKLIDGQAQDISYEHRDLVTVEECLEMEGNKTGALLACAASIGAVLGGADDRTADALEAYGHHLGLAFQAVDDLLGIWGDPQATGKQTWSDLRQRKKSLPVAAALGSEGPAAARLAKLMTQDAKKSQAEFEDFQEAEFAERAALIEEAGGREWTSQEAQRQHTTALAALDSVEMPGRVRDRFAALADFVVVRRG
ncbi:polyprenyl synthetase family protein [Streptomyces smyrnaeus]|uniref:polyprenyl synthetase family protein n=1 Tax=Streptomyces smyrnaeus TaxID=1387713 RepID=UPI0033B9D6B0